jgi:hypothetical protein
MNSTATAVFRAFALSGLMHAAALADWSDDPTVNLTVAGGPATQSNPVVRPAAVRGFHVGHEGISGRRRVRRF